MANQYNGNLLTPTAPNLPIAPVDYSQQYQDQVLNTLRLYFNQITNSIGQIVSNTTGTSATNPSYVITNNESPYALPPYLQIARGLVTGCSVVNINGYQNAVPNSSGATYYPVWENATAYPAYPSTAIQMWILSTSASDTAVQVIINGLDGSYNPISETITTNGTTHVITANKYLRVNGLKITGTVNNVGTINIVDSATTTTNQYAEMSPGTGQSEMSIYTVPNGYTFYLTRTQTFTSLVGNTALNYANYRVYTMNNGLTTYVLQAPFVNLYSSARVAPRPYPAKTDIQWQVSGNPSSGTSSFGVTVEGILVANGTA
jgi:hypothetical protein